MATELAAGPELDGRVAEQVFGAIRVPLGAVRWDGAMPPIVWAYQVGETTAYYTSLPAYSTDIAAAWLVVEQMRTQRWQFASDDRLEEVGPWWVEFTTTDFATGAQAHAPTFPLAVCRAALATLATARPC